MQTTASEHKMWTYQPANCGISMFHCSFRVLIFIVFCGPEKVVACRVMFKRKRWHSKQSESKM